MSTISYTKETVSAEKTQSMGLHSPVKVSVIKIGDTTRAVIVKEIGKTESFFTRLKAIVSAIFYQQTIIRDSVQKKIYIVEVSKRGRRALASVSTNYWLFRNISKHDHENVD